MANLKNMNTILQSEPLLYSKATAARLLGVSPWTIMRLVQRGELQPRKVGDRVMFSKQELEKFALGVGA